MGVKSFNDIHAMVSAYKQSPLKDNTRLKTLDEVEFMGLIYNLDTGRFGINGFCVSSFLRFFMTSGGTSDENWAMDIINNLQYSKRDFVELAQ